MDRAVRAKPVHAPKLCVEIAVPWCEGLRAARAFGALGRDGTG
ncbi:hypothetical protein N5B55_01135 [Ralstonia pickettii]|nr:hypothetical protein [Ralstonia pickettii]WKZ85588.1 hypothetical protein N5B55_01135 [Ralstonia pickettii]